MLKKYARNVYMRNSFSLYSSIGTYIDAYDTYQYLCNSSDGNIQYIYNVIDVYGTYIKLSPEEMDTISLRLHNHGYDFNGVSEVRIPKTSITHSRPVPSVQLVNLYNTYTLCITFGIKSMNILYRNYSMTDFLYWPVRNNILKFLRQRDEYISGLHYIPLFEIEKLCEKIING